jgi:hypothetical protein
MNIVCHSLQYAQGSTHIAVGTVDLRLCDMHNVCSTLR